MRANVASEPPAGFQQLGKLGWRWIEALRRRAFAATSPGRPPDRNARSWPDRPSSPRAMARRGDTDRSGRRCRLRRSRLPARGSPGAIRRDSWRPRGGSGREPNGVDGRAGAVRSPAAPSGRSYRIAEAFSQGGSVSQRGAVASPSHPAAKALPPRDAWATHPAGRTPRAGRDSGLSLDFEWGSGRPGMGIETHGPRRTSRER